MPQQRQPRRKVWQVLNFSQRQRLAAVLAQSGAPQLFWPGIERVVVELCVEHAAAEVRRALKG